MANGSDGSIVIDTELDNEGFEKGSGKLLASVKSFGDQIAKAGEDIKGSLREILPVLNSIAASTAQINSKIAGTATQTADANARVAESEQRVSQAAQEAAQAVNRQGQSMGTLSTGASAAQQNMTALEKEVNALSTGMAAVSKSAETGFANGNAVLSFDAKLSEMEAKLTAAREKLEAFAQTKIPTEDYQWLTNAVEKAEAEYDKLIERQAKLEATGVKQNAKAWENLQYDISLAQQKIADYKGEMAYLESNGGAFVSGADTEQFQRMEASVNQTAASIERNRALIDSEALAQARLNAQVAQEAVVRATTAGEREAATARLRAAQQELNDLASSMSSGAASGADPVMEKWNNMITLSGQLRSSFERIKEAASMAFTAITHPIQTADRLFGSITAKAKSVAATLSKLPFQAAAKGMRKLAEGIGNFIKKARAAKNHSNSLVKSLTSLKRMLITRIKRMFISAIFNEAKESLQTLAKFSDAFNASMSNIKNGSKELSGNLAVALGNLISSFEPMITGLLNTLSKAITYINALFAMLGGKATMTVAKKQTDSYRDSLDGASKSAEELKNQVYGFDELNKRSDNESSSASDGSDLFEEVPVDSVLPESLKEAFEELKKLWEDGDYFNFGKKLAELFNNALQSIDDWINGTLRPKGKEWAKNIAEILNGLVDGLDWNLLGKTFADGLNAVFDIVNTFLTTFDFEKLGKGIGEAINGWFDNIECDLLATTVANGLNAIVDTIHGIVTEVEWANMGDSIAEFVRTFFEAVDWDKAAETISTAVNGIVEAFQHFLSGVDWKKIGSETMTAVSDAITGIDWAALLQTIVDAFEALEDLIIGAIEGTDWKGIAKSLADGINGLDLATLLANAGKIVSDFISGVLDFSIELIEEIDWTHLAQTLWDGLVGMLQNVDWGGIISKVFELLGAAIGGAAAFVLTLGENIWELLKEAWESVKTYFSDYIDQFGGDIIAGLWAGIKNAFVNVGTWIKENIFDPFINGFKKAFGINSPSTEMATMGTYIVKGLLQGIKNTWNSIVSFFSTALETIKTTLSNAWNAIKTTASTAWEGIKTTVSQKFDAAKTAISNTANTIKTTLSGAWENVKSTASTAWENIKSTLTTKFESAKTALAKTADNIKSNLSTVWENVKSTASTAWEKVKTTVAEKFDSMKSNLSTSSNTIKTTLSSAWSNIQTNSSTTWNSIKSAVQNAFSSLPSSISNNANSIKASITTAWNSIQTSTTSAWNNLKNNVVSLWNGLKSTLQSSSSSWSSIGTSLVSGLRSGISSAWSSLTSWVSSLASSLTSTLRSIFSIHSPSKVWAQIGEYLDLGLKQGLESEQDNVLATVSNLAKDVNKEITGDEATLSIGTEADGMVSRLGGITDKLADIVSVFQSINSTLESIGGIRVPVIAAGQEIPYKTRLSETGGYDPFGSGKFETFSNDLDDRMYDMVSLLRRLVDRFDTKRFVDNRELADEIATALGTKLRAYGGV